MKKTISFIMSAILTTSILISSCSGIDDTSTAAESETYTGSYGKYAQIGTDVYAALQNRFGNRENARAALNGDYDLEVADETTTPTIEELKESGAISALSASYIQRIEAAIDSELSANEVFDAIFAIEEEALEELAEIDADAVMSYAETAKATLAYFENIVDDNNYPCDRRAGRDKSEKKATRDKNSKKSFGSRLKNGCKQFGKDVLRVAKAAARGAVEGAYRAGRLAYDSGAHAGAVTRAGIYGAIDGASMAAAREISTIYKERRRGRDR